MRWILNLVLLIVAAGMTSYFTSIWWSGLVVCFLVGLLLKPDASFLLGFLGIFLLWLCMSFFLDIQNESRLSSAIAEILPLGGSTILLIFVSSLIGALPAGFAVWSGRLLRG